MIIKLLDLKDEMLRNGEMLIDFTENNFEVNYADPFISLSKVILVEDKHLCRLDLLSYEAYGDINYMDVILKFNQITNPFSMDIYDLILIPTLRSIDRFYKKEKKITRLIKDTKSLFIDPTRASEKDQNRLKQLEEISKKRKNGSLQPKPTNLLRSNEVPFLADGSRLILAPTISSRRE